MLLSRCARVSFVKPRFAATAAAVTFVAVDTLTFCQSIERTSLDTPTAHKRRPPPRRRPPLFGANPPLLNRGTEFVPSGKRSLSSEVTGNNVPLDSDRDDDDCPICRKYGKGPCGELFKTWLKCTDANPGKDEMTGEDLHILLCENFAVPLAQCLEENKDHYDGPLLQEEDEEEDVEKLEELREAWSTLVQDLESNKHERVWRHFPEGMQPEMEVRFNTMEGMAVFSPIGEEENVLILVYVKDQKGTLLGAGSREDFDNNGGVLRFGITDDTASVTACAVYGNSQMDLIYTHEELLPPREDR